MLIERQMRLVKLIRSWTGQRGLAVGLNTGQGGEALPSPFRDPLFLHCTRAVPVA